MKLMMELMLLAQKDMNCLIKWYLMNIVKNMIGDRYYEPARSTPDKRAGKEGQNEGREVKT